MSALYVTILKIQQPNYLTKDVLPLSSAIFFCAADRLSISTRTKIKAAFGNRSPIRGRVRIGRTAIGIGLGCETTEIGQNTFPRLRDSPARPKASHAT